MTSKRWDQRYLSLAAQVSTWSKDPRKQVGAVVVENYYVRGIGFNGFPRGIKDSQKRLGDKNLKNKIVVHAEVNALVASEGKGDTIYVWPCLPCTQCLGLIIQSGIKRVVTGPIDDNSDWDQDLVIELAEEAGLDVRILEDVLNVDY